MVLRFFKNKEKVHFLKKVKVFRILILKDEKEFLKFGNAEI